MSTPSVTILKNLVLNWKSNQMEEETIATFYRHYDGYPSCHAIDIANSLVVASRTKPEQHIDFSGASVERNILNNRNWCQHFLKAMCMADADIEFIGEDNVPSASYTLVCYNTGYRVGKLKGLPSRRKGIMNMARYHYTRENENGVVLYLESEPAEDAMDEFDDEIAVGFSGNGYLSFWTRCRRAAEALPNGVKYAAGGRCVITDTFTGEEKIWRVGR